MTPTIRRNISVVFVLIGLMFAIKLFDLAAMPEHAYPGRVAAFPWIELAITAIAGLIGAVLAARTRAIRLWPDAPGLTRVLIRALLAGGILGAALAGLDAWLRIGDISVGLPLAPVFYLWGAISQETITHFAPVALVVGLVSFATSGRRAQGVAFWLTAVAMSAMAALGMMGAFQNPDIPLTPQVAAAPMMIGAAVFAIELALFGVFRARGFVAALAMRLGFYAIWHIAWPALTY